MKSAAPLALACLMGLTGTSLSVELPKTVETPPERPRSETTAPQSPPTPTPSPEAVPVPAEKPAEANAPLPEPRPEPPAKAQLPVEPGELLKQPPPELGGPKQKPVKSADEIACQTELSKLGARFEEQPPVQEPEGCAIPYPLALTRLTAEIDIAPGLTVNCATALTAAKFAKDVISPMAQKEFGSPLASITQASGYVCRPRNGTNKLSEHAFGNAIDIASFTLGDKKTIEVEPAPSTEHEKFLREVRAAACGPFKTVLGPGSDADHSLHFHFDLAQRRNGGTFCQ